MDKEHSKGEEPFDRGEGIRRDEEVRANNALRPPQRLQLLPMHLLCVHGEDVAFPSRGACRGSCTHGVAEDNTGIPAVVVLAEADYSWYQTGLLLLLLLLHHL